MSDRSDVITAAIVSAAYFYWGFIMLLRVNSRDGIGDAVTGVSAWMVSAIYSAPLLLDIPVVELRGALRLALFIYAGNQIIKHRAIASERMAQLLKRLTHRK